MAEMVNQGEAVDKTESLVHSLDEKPAKTEVKVGDGGNKMKTFLVIGGIVLAGVASGLGVAWLGGGQTAGVNKSLEEVAETGVRVGDVVGAQDKETFGDDVEGVLVEGGVDGEGSHHLLREGGTSQNVYLTSSVVDLDLFIGHRVKVWGETFSAQRAGWLMDVGRVEVLELEAELPFEEE